MAYKRKRAYAGATTARGVLAKRTRYVLPIGPTLRGGQFYRRQLPPVVGRVVAGEMKYFDCELIATPVPVVTTTWIAGTSLDPGTTINLGDAAVATPLCLFAPKVSAALNGRIGRSVKMMKVKLHAILNVPVQSGQTAGDPPVVARVILVQDKQTNAAQMTAAQLMRDGGGSNTTLMSFQNPDNFGRFRVLKDKVFTFQNPNAADLSATNASFEQMGLVRHFKMSHRFAIPVDVHFNATNGGTVADIVDHSIHVVAGINSTGLAPTISYYSRVSFKE